MMDWSFILGTVAPEPADVAGRDATPISERFEMVFLRKVKDWLRRLLASLGLRKPVEQTPDPIHAQVEASEVVTRAVGAPEEDRERPLDSADRKRDPGAGDAAS